ncbi:unnamed protein product [Parnassius apollo]|uniref:(apollo) hypothetical protein n=1 Tax=Parnassius apollo TaxID=110799 RepID=A0A8S3X4T0_PARAO|nr:unnamed protein product [Parnassius apollo]
MSTNENNSDVTVDKVEDKKTGEAKSDLKGAKRAAEDKVTEAKKARKEENGGGDDEAHSEEDDLEGEGDGEEEDDEEVDEGEEDEEELEEGEEDDLEDEEVEEELLGEEEEEDADARRSTGIAPGAGRKARQRFPLPPPCTARGLVRFAARRCTPAPPRIRRDLLASGARLYRDMATRPRAWKITDRAPSIAARAMHRHAVMDDCATSQIVEVHIPDAFAV